MELLILLSQVGNFCLILLNDSLGLVLLSWLLELVNVIFSVYKMASEFFCSVIEAVDFLKQEDWF